MRAQDVSAGRALRDHLKLEGARRTVRQALDKEYREAQLPGPSPLEPLCVKHDWNPEPRHPGAPRPPASECPGCLEEAHPGRSAEEVRSLEHPRELPHPLQVGETPRMAIAYGKKLDEQDAKTLAEAGPWAQDEIRRHRMFGGGGLSAEAIKRLAVDRADETREEAIDRDRGRKGRNPAYVAGMFGPAEDRVYIYRPKRWK